MENTTQQTTSGSDFPQFCIEKVCKEADYYAKMEQAMQEVKAEANAELNEMAQVRQESIEELIN